MKEEISLTVAPKSVLEVIANAVTDPRVDVDKMERLLAMQERVIKADQERAFNEALAQLQAELPIITKDGRIIVKGVERSKYARFEDIHAVLKPLLTKHGFAVSFKEGTATDDKTEFIIIVKHRAGHSEESARKFTTDKAAVGQYGPIRTAIQDDGSTTSYARRYLICMYFNVVTVDADNDGNGPAEAITDDQAIDILAKLDELHANKQKFLEYMGVAEVGAILQRDYKKAITALERKARK